MEDITISRVDANRIDLLDAALRMLAADLGDDYAADKSTLAEALSGEAPGSFAFLAIRDGAALGAVLVSPVFSTTRGGAGLFVSDLWVETSVRGRGLARRLLSVALREGARRGSGRFIKLSVYHDNPDARAAYQRLGFAARNGETNMVLAAGALENPQVKPMKAIFDDRQRYHRPRHFMANGAILPNPERVERIDRLTAGAKAAGCQFQTPADAGFGPIAALHSPEYLTFLETIHTRWKRIDGAGEEVIPNIHPANRTDGYPRSAVGQAGFHQADTACPIAEGTWEAAYWSAQTAITGAREILSGEGSVYALSRPPGHHAFEDLAGGFCFLNNSAIAAEVLRAGGLRPAILDVDVHHGNGTQGLFYHRSDVLTVSIHASPERFYPFFWGYAHERGAGQGMGYNLNLPLPRGTGDDEYLATLDLALGRIRAFGADCVVVALGLDAFVGDPFKGLAVTTDGFGRIGAAIGTLGLPSLFVQEGGYLCDQLGNNLSSVLNGFTEKSA